MSRCRCEEETRDYLEDEARREEAGMATYKVYGIKQIGCLFSEGVSRVFGVNKLITTDAGDSFLASVQPLRVNPSELGMEVIGTIEVEGER